MILTKNKTTFVKATHDKKLTFMRYLSISKECSRHVALILNPALLMRMSIFLSGFFEKYPSTMVAISSIFDKSIAKISTFSGYLQLFLTLSNSFVLLDVINSFAPNSENL